MQFQVPGIGMYDGAQKFGYGNGGFDDSDPTFAPNKQMSKSTVFAESNFLKAFPEKEKAAPVAKIKVVVCFLVLSIIFDNYSFIEKLSLR
jgi:kinesin family protein 2/24